MTIKILILGSCVSRDPFGHPVNPDSGFTLLDYYARTSLASRSAPRPYADFDLSSNPSAFQRKMVERDLKKDFFDTLTQLDFDILLVDFIDDRLPLLKLKDSSIITNSPEFRATNPNLSKLEAESINPFSADFFCLWKSGWETIMKSLQRLNKANAILINPVFWAQQDDRGGIFPNQTYIQNANKYLTQIYETAAETLGSRQFISYGDQQFIGKSDHKWGKSPFHYTTEIEQLCLAGIQKYHQEISDE